MAFPHHDRAKYCKLIIKMACLFNVTCLECDLETGAAHSEPHAVHVNVVWFGTPCSTAVVVGELLNER